MPFEEDRGRTKEENLEDQVRLVSQSLKLQKAAWEAERNELRLQINAHKKEIKWLRDRSISHVLGQWFWLKISKFRQRQRDEYRNDNYF